MQHRLEKVTSGLTRCLEATFLKKKTVQKSATDGTTMQKDKNRNLNKEYLTLNRNTIDLEKDKVKVHEEVLFEEDDEDGSSERHARRKNGGKMKITKEEFGEEPDNPQNEPGNKAVLKPFFKGILKLRK